VGGGGVFWGGGFCLRTGAGVFLCFSWFLFEVFFFGGVGWGGGGGFFGVLFLAFTFLFGGRLAGGGGGCFLFWGDLWKIPSVLDGTRNVEASRALPLAKEIPFRFQRKPDSPGGDSKGKKNREAAFCGRKGGGRIWSIIEALGGKESGRT